MRMYTIKFVFAKIIIYSMLFCFAGISSAKDIPVVTNLTDLENIVNFTWVSNSINRLMPPAKDCVYNNSLGAIAYNDGFDTNFIASLTSVVLYNGTNEFVMYPVEVIETNNISGRIRNYYSAISTNSAVLHSNEVSIANYPISWIENIYGEPPAYLSGSAIQDWYDACDPMRQHVLCDLLSSNSVPDYLIMLTNSVGYYTEGTNTNSVLSLYSNCIAVVQCSISAEDAELYLHAPDDISILDVYKSTNLLEQYSWELDATLEHNLDPLRYIAGFDAYSMYYSLGNGVLDSDGDGLLDARELALFGTDPDSVDSDEDSLSDGEEVLYYRLNPLNSDTDNDGLDDGWEVQYGFNPYDSTVNDTDADPDHDGLSNSEEYLLGTDPCNPDTDGDGRSDGAENSFGTDACKFDTDGDGLSDGYEDNRKIVMWGNNDDGQCDVPTNLPDIVSVACGGHHTLALRFDGTVAAWGHNTLGQTNVPSNLTDVIAISAGYYHSVALKNDGTVVAWGHNGNSQCDVPNGLTNVTAVACGNYHTLALKSNGTVVAWGLNSNGQTNVPYLHSVTTIGAGSSHSMAIWKPETFSYFKAWGWNNYGQCTLPPSWGYTEKAIDGGNAHSVAINNIGGVIAWGNNTFGQCNVPGGLSSGVTIISTKFNHTLALKSDGTVVAWGQNTAGQCNVPAGLSDVTAISAGTAHNAVLEPSKLNSLSVDTDGDLLPDGWEVKYELDPLVENNIHTDVDDDDLDLFDEYRYVTDPFSSDTDGDGVSDGDEVPHSRGSNPNDADDFGSSSNCVTMLLTVGDPSGSHSERWNFNVFDGDKPVIRHVDDGFGTPGSNEYALVKGKEYKYEIQWIDHNQENFDYDWQALINDLTVSGFYEGLYNTGGFIVEDPDSLLTSFENGSDVNLTEGKEGTIIVPLVRIRSDYDHSGVVGDIGDANTNGEYNVTGLVVPISTNNLGKIELDILPDNMDVSDIELAIEKIGGGDIKVWTTPTRQEGSLLLYSLDANMMDTEWSLSESYHASEIPDTLYVEGVDDSSAAGDVSLILKVKYDDDIVTTTTQKITVVSLDLDVDTDRDGVVEVDEDEIGEDDWTEDSGAIYNVNFDRDGTNKYGSLPAPDAIHFDDDGGPCNENYFIDNEDDELDIAPLLIREIQTRLPAGWKVYLKAAEIDDIYNVHVYKKIEASEENKAIWGSKIISDESPPMTQEIEVTQWVDQFGTNFQGSTVTGDSTFGIEGLSFRYDGADVLPTKHFDGYIDLTLELRCGDTVIDSDAIRMKVAPWIMLSREQASEEIWAADDGESNDEFLFNPEQDYYALTNSAQLCSVANQNNQWFQDHVEIGFTQRPGGPKTHIVFRLPYINQPTWPLSNLLTNDVGCFQLGRKISNEDYSANIGGNLEVLSPTTDYPLGIIELGNSGVSVLLKQFLESQEVQSPKFDLPVGWLTVGHIDEVTSFLPNGDVVLADTIAAWDLMEELPDYSLFFAKGATPVGGTVPSNSVEIMQCSPPIVKIYTGIDHTEAGTPDWQYIRIYDDSASGSGAKGSIGQIYTKHNGYVIATNVYYTGSKIMNGESITNSLTDDYASLARSVSVLNWWGTNQYSYPLQGDKFVLCEESLSWAKAPAIVTVSEILGDNNFANLNTNLIQSQLHTIETNILSLSSEYSVTNVPAMFFGETIKDSQNNTLLVSGSSFAFVPGATNLQPVNDKLYVPRQFGPVNSNGVDVFENAIETALGGSVRFVDCWNWYHLAGGEVHCGSNVKREKLNINWWENL